MNLGLQPGPRVFNEIDDSIKQFGQPVHEGRTPGNEFFVRLEILFILLSMWELSGDKVKQLYHCQSR